MSTGAPLALATASTRRTEDGERDATDNTSSIAGSKVRIGQLPHTAAKAGLGGVALTVATDLGSPALGMRALTPTLFATGRAEGISQEPEDALLRDTTVPAHPGPSDQHAEAAAVHGDAIVLSGQGLRLHADERSAS